MGEREGERTEEEEEEGERGKKATVGGIVESPREM